MNLYAINESPSYSHVVKTEKNSSYALANMITSLSEAEIALQTIAELRNEMIGSYRDIIKGF